MPMYIDRHDAPGVSPQDLADAHLRDVSVQDRHDVRYHTYWFDPHNGSIFCLAEGPNKEAVEAVHRESHGLLASTILEIDATAPLNEFFGSLPAHPVGTPYRSAEWTQGAEAMSVVGASGDGSFHRGPASPPIG